MKIQHQVLQYGFSFLVGGLLYGIIEVLYKGNTHISMIIAGGIAFVLIGVLNEGKKNPSLIGQMVVSAMIITIVELITGLIVNEWLHLNVWDYSHLPYNLRGQICLLFTCLWFLLSLPAIFLDDFIRQFVFRQKRHHYHIL